MSSKDFIVHEENDSEAWNNQLELEERRRLEEERKNNPQVREVVELLSRSVALLKHIPEKQYPVINDIRKRLTFEREFLRTRQSLSLNNLVKTAKRLLNNRGTEDRDAAFRAFSLDHYKNFEFWPMKFEYDEIVYDSAWVWGQLEKFNFFQGTEVKPKP